MRPIPSFNLTRKCYLTIPVTTIPRFYIFSMDYNRFFRRIKKGILLPVYFITDRLSKPVTNLLFESLFKKFKQLIKNHLSVFR